MATPTLGTPVTFSSNTTSAISHTAPNVTVPAGYNGLLVLIGNGFDASTASVSNCTYGGVAVPACGGAGNPINQSSNRRATSRLLLTPTTGVAQSVVVTLATASRVNIVCVPVKDLDTSSLAAAQRDVVGAQSASTGNLSLSYTGAAGELLISFGVIGSQDTDNLSLSGSDTLLAQVSSSQTGVNGLEVIAGYRTLADGTAQTITITHTGAQSTWAMQSLALRGAANTMQPGGTIRLVNREAIHRASRW